MPCNCIINFLCCSQSKLLYLTNWFPTLPRGLPPFTTVPIPFTNFPARTRLNRCRQLRGLQLQRSALKCNESSAPTAKQLLWKRVIIAQCPPTPTPPKITGFLRQRCPLCRTHACGGARGRGASGISVVARRSTHATHARRHTEYSLSSTARCSVSGWRWLHYVCGVLASCNVASKAAE